MPKRKITFKDHDQFLRFAQLYFQRQGVAAALQALQAQMAQQLQAMDGELAAIARYEGIPLDKALELDAKTGKVTWHEGDGKAKGARP